MLGLNLLTEMETRLMICWGPSDNLYIKSCLGVTDSDPNIWGSTPTANDL